MSELVRIAERGATLLGKRLLLLTKCAEQNLIITNTLFKQKNEFKTSWMHPRFKLNLIDYDIVRAGDRLDVHLTRAMASTDGCWTIVSPSCHPLNYDHQTNSQKEREENAMSPLPKHQEPGNA